MKTFLFLSLAVALVLPCSVMAQQRPRVTKKQAEVVAVNAVKGGKILSAEYEHESGKYIWSLDVKSGSLIKEVWVDPMSGKVIKISSESMMNEKDEKAEEAGKAKVTKAEAEKIALKAVPGGKVTEAELEHESGMFIWSLDVKSGKTNKEVWISPESGKVLKVFTEEGSEEAHEKD